MSWYHIKIEWNHEYDGLQWRKDVNFTEEQVKELTDQIKKGSLIIFSGNKIGNTIEGITIWKTDGDASSNTPSQWDWIKTHGKDVTKEFIISLPDKQKESIGNNTSARKGGKTTPSKDVFIVHGIDHEPMKELKAMLIEFGFNPIVLHEQPSGSRTIVEKLEKHSDVGYAFVILTPDDWGGTKDDFLSILDGMARGFTDLEDAFHDKELQYRARQNVILEFGYFIGRLGRDRVCCLYKGDIESPSDMHGIVYVPFKDSVEERRGMIIKELTEAGYEIKT